jgi:hypothetical protein
MAWYKNFDQNQPSVYDATGFMNTADGIYVGG